MPDSKPSNGIHNSTNTGANWTKVCNPTMDALIVDGSTIGGTLTAENVVA